MAKNKSSKEKAIRVIITGGESMDTITVSKRPTLAILVTDRQFYPQKFYRDGVKVITYEYKREIPQVKSLNYIQAVRGISIAKKKGAIEAIYIDKKLDKVFEGTQSSLFLVKDKKIFTPNGDTLPSITRELIIKISKKLYPTFIQDIKIDELYNADEIFLASSNKEVLPVVKVDNKIIGRKRPGEITKKVMQEFKKFIDKENW